MTAVAVQPLQRPPLPLFTRESAVEKVRLAEDAWNSRDPERVSLAYTGGDGRHVTPRFTPGTSAPGCMTDPSSLGRRTHCLDRFEDWLSSRS
jgi:hypothetical protein